MVQMKIGRNSTERPVSRGPQNALEHHKKLCILPMTTCESRMPSTESTRKQAQKDRRTRMQMHHAPILMPTRALTTEYRHNDGAILCVLNRIRTSSFTKIQHRHVVKLQSCPAAGASFTVAPCYCLAPHEKNNTPTWRAQQ
jgi:hypothetical protein